jgi:hypothetical protein
VKSVGGAIACALLLALAGCGDDGGDQVTESRTSTAVTTVATETAVTTAPPEEPPAGPVVRICDKRLAAAMTSAFRDQGFRGRLPAMPTPGGNPRLSVCDLEGEHAEISVSLDAASQAVRRYRNRVTESAQFSTTDPEDAPQTVKGIGDRELGGAGANWLPRTHLLLSARGERVLIVDVSADPLSDPQLFEAAKTISLDAWERLER